MRIPSRGWAIEFSLEHFREALSDRYRIDSEIGEGGMSTVYVAEDLRHHRKVAIKLLAPELSTTIGLERFLREIELIAGLQHPNLLTLIDSGDVDGLPYYVMPFVEGQSLKEYLEREGTLTLERAIAIAREVLDGLDYAHRRGVFHRDIKPSNILMSGDHAIVADFGIAMALEKATVGRLTQMGASLGSPIYMSPEQAAGEHDLDARTDIYSMGCVLYEMLAGVAPIEDDSLQRAMTLKMMGDFQALREQRSDVPASLDTAVSKALATDRDWRFATAGEFAAALQAALKPAGARLKVPTLIAAVVVILLLGGFGYAMMSENAERALELSRDLAELEQLAEDGNYAEAFELGEQIVARAPEDTTLARLQPLFIDFVPVVTDPPGAVVKRKRYGEGEAAWTVLGTSPLDSVREVKWGDQIAHHYRVELEGHRPVEFLAQAIAPWAEWRNVYGLDTIRLDPEDLLPAEMVRIPGFPLADPLHPEGDSLHLGDFFLDRHEVSNRDFKEFVDDGGYSNPGLWLEPFEEAGRVLSFEEAMARLTDRTGRPGPSTWELGAYPEGQADHPVGGLSWFEAAAYARFRDKVLPSAWHWQQAAIRHRREASWVYQPTSNLGSQGPRPVGGTMETFNVYDLAGNVREWTSNRMGEGRVTRGAGWADAAFHVGYYIDRPAFDRSPDNGVRLARHFEDDSTAAHFDAPVEPTPRRDFTTLTPVPESEARIYLSQFNYDPAPLDAEEELVHSGEHYRVLRVSFEAAYAGPRMVAFVFLPNAAEPPFQPIVFWPGSGAMTERRFDPEVHLLPTLRFLPRSGRALVYPLYMGSYERDNPDYSTTVSVPRETTAFRDLTIQWIKDFRRTVDWIESRDELDAERIGFYGISWGGQIAPMALASEPRVKAAALLIGGLWWGRTPLPEVEAFNYLQLVTTPVLMLNGEHDMVFPYETTQVPFYERLATPADQKEHLVFPTSHDVPQGALVPAVLDWFDRFLGPLGS